MLSALHQKYKNEVAKALKEKFNFSSFMQVPRIEKVVVNVGCGNATQDKKYLESSINELTLITCQKPQVTKAKKSIADFKLREGQAVGLKVTLRNKVMWSFLEKLFSVAIPRTRDFRGISLSSFDKNGNLNIGIKEQIIFTEINYDNIKKNRGMNVSIITSSKKLDESIELMKLLGCPFSLSKQ